MGNSWRCRPLVIRPILEVYIWKEYTYAYIYEAVTNKFRDSPTRSQKYTLQCRGVARIFDRAWIHWLTRFHELGRYRAFFPIFLFFGKFLPAKCIVIARIWQYSDCYNSDLILPHLQFVLLRFHLNLVHAGVKIRFFPGDDVAVNAVWREEYEIESFILYILQNYGKTALLFENASLRYRVIPV